jgi:hypothetical protein
MDRSADALSKPLLSIRKSLTEQRAVNRPLTEYAQFVNQSESLGIGLAQYRVSTPMRRTTSNHPATRNGSGLACRRHAERLSSE